MTIKKLLKGNMMLPVYIGFTILLALEIVIIVGAVRDDYKRRNPIPSHKIVLMDQDSTMHYKWVYPEDNNYRVGDLVLIKDQPEDTFIVISN